MPGEFGQVLSGIRILVSGLQFVGLNNILHPEALQYFSACVFQKSFLMKAKNSLKIENLKFHRQRIFLMRIDSKSKGGNLICTIFSSGRTSNVKPGKYPQSRLIATLLNFANVISVCDPHQTLKSRKTVILWHISYFILDFPRLKTYLCTS